MKISVITTFYNGNKFMNNYFKNILKAVGKNEVEVILVNDSPQEKIVIDNNVEAKINLKIIENDTNYGIHKSRVIGLEQASGEYIIFLDQDDELTNNSIETFLEILSKSKDVDLIIGNGLIEDKNGYHRIFANNFSQRFATKKRPYIMARDFIVSPGQCLIRKKSIPEYWKNNILKNNGTDDYLLWLLMFNQNINVKCNYNIIYIHNYTGENLSGNENKMNKSRKELLSILENNKLYSKRDYKKLKRTIEYKINYKKNFWTETLKNLDIFIYNLYYRIVWKGYLQKKL